MTIAEAEQAGAVTPAGHNLPEGWVITELPDVCRIYPPRPAKDALPPDATVTFVPMPAVDAYLQAITTPESRPFAEVRPP